MAVVGDKREVMRIYEFMSALNTKSSNAPSTDDLLKIIQAQQKQIDSLTGYMKDSENKRQTMERHTTQTPIDRFTNANESSTERCSNQYPMDRRPLIDLCIVTVVEDRVISRRTAALHRTGTTVRKTSSIYCYESTNRG